MNRLLFIAIAIVVLGIAAISIVLLASPPDLTERTEDILSDISAGSYEEVWQAASPEFQARYPLERFGLQMKDFHSNLGTFRRVLSSRASGPAEDGLTFELEYAKGQAFCYIVLDTEAAPPRLQDLLLRKTVRSTLPESTLPESTLPESTLPESTLPESTLPESTPPEKTPPKGS